MKLLLDAGANIDAQSVNGGTPIMRAIETSQKEVVKLLIDRGYGNCCCLREIGIPINYYYYIVVIEMKLIITDLSLSLSCLSSFLLIALPLS